MLYRVMADLARAWHWQPGEMKQMEVEELLRFHRLL
ncbi:GpE family phage tail protein [Sulfurivirga sp.]|nr:GpE family phage tail protein [Sulfurivirga sp.]